MIWKILADVVALVHGLWALIVLIGPLISFRWPSFRWVHVLMMGFTITLMLAGKYCPLTFLEHRLRERFDPSRKHEGGFIVNALSKYAGVTMTLRTFFILFLLWLAVWSIAYVALWPNH